MRWRQATNLEKRKVDEHVETVVGIFYAIPKLTAAKVLTAKVKGSLKVPEIARELGRTPPHPVLMGVLPNTTK